MNPSKTELNLKKILLWALAILVLFVIVNSIRISLKPSDTAENVPATQFAAASAYGPPAAPPSGGSSGGGAGSITIGGTTIKPTWDGGPGIKIKIKF
ncbi:MAG: hypothetical protein JWN90_235 [Parcubacteria group bacterium]|nr:hypothetical protein [Parcubacteria group bacterium]